MNIKPIERSKLARTVSDSLLEMVKSGDLKPGERIPTEMKLAEAYNVSRNVIRESLKTLEILGIFESKVAKGTFVHENAKENLSQYEFWTVLQNNTHMKELTEVRLSLEPELAYYAAKRRTEKDLEEMRSFLKEAADIDSMPDYRQYFDRTYMFHIMVANASQNTIMAGFLDMVYGQIKQDDVSQFSIEKKIFKNQVGHDKIFEAIEKQQSNKAKKLMFDHIYPVYAFFHNDELNSDK